jgi:hypothetical protein
LDVLADVPLKSGPLAEGPVGLFVQAKEMVDTSSE